MCGSNQGHHWEDPSERGGEKISGNVCQTNKLSSVRKEKKKKPKTKEKTDPKTPNRDKRTSMGI